MPRNTGLPVVPQELCEIIVDFSRDDLSTLAACSLVSSAWLPISRKHTFSAITLRTSSDVDDLLTISSAGLLGSNHIPRLVRDLCIGGDRDDNQSVLLNPRLRDLFEQFTSVKTLRLRYLKWLEVSAGHEPVRVLASKATHLHMHYLVFHAQVNLIQLLCSSPEKRSLNITGLGFHVMVPEALCRAEDLAFISPVVHIASMTTNFVSFICFHLTMHWAYISNCPLSLSIDRLTINDYGPEHTVSSAHDLDSITTIYIDFLEMQLEDSAEHALARGVDDEVPLLC
ncbi:uncharacterized protein C8Q71DRAFT_189110 [Rhodofomes roseus]|uniref:F-box domain-containing protein n=1 Tax=Rhodofomes roseus TaxID=34475 RepID=A0ABQ8K8M4_9APHY|nr:uncharacterized protein C8Q71DRAFT_189110 [Rhodofomes roseus]KAH9833549.1 hypothetical protein C8Q71DRAFT_189110 [Rhodofomes roseus]